MLEAYRNGREIPLGGYATLFGVWATSLAGFTWLMRDRLVAPRLTQIALIGVATHEISQAISHSWVAAPLRAPFTENQGEEGGDPVDQPRGSGLRYAIGKLVTCPFCLGPWVSGALLAASVVAPAPARFITGVFAATALSNYLNRARAVAAGKARVASGEAKLVNEAVERAQA